jgi:hypothetical protein
MAKTAKKLNYTNSVVITNRIATDLPRIEAALRALTVKTNDPETAKLTGLISNVVAQWDKVLAKIVTEKAIEHREAELEMIKAKQAAKRGESPETKEDETDFDL